MLEVKNVNNNKSMNKSVVGAIKFKSLTSKGKVFVNAFLKDTDMVVGSVSNATFMTNFSWRYSKYDFLAFKNRYSGCEHDEQIITSDIISHCGMNEKMAFIVDAINNKNNEKDDEKMENNNVKTVLTKDAKDFILKYGKDVKLAFNNAVAEVLDLRAQVKRLTEENNALKTNLEVAVTKAEDDTLVTNKEENTKALDNDLINKLISKIDSLEKRVNALENNKTCNNNVIVDANKTKSLCDMSIGELKALTPKDFDINSLKDITLKVLDNLTYPCLQKIGSLLKLGSANVAKRNELTHYIAIELELMKNSEDIKKEKSNIVPLMPNISTGYTVPSNNSLEFNSFDLKNEDFADDPYVDESDLLDPSLLEDDDIDESSLNADIKSYQDEFMKTCRFSK